MDRIDFRSDTVSWPTDKMRQAMANAKVGDDVYGEDPTVKELERITAEMTGKEAALYTASGTMGNFVSILAHATRGEQAIVGVNAHTFLSEGGGMAALGGVVPHTLPTDEMGRMDTAEMEAAISPDNEHYSRKRLILVENSYGRRQGYPVPLDYFEEVRGIADRNEVIVHLDGARVCNAAVALNEPLSRVVRDVDSVSICLSKGLCSPVGTVIAGSEEFIHKAHRVRKAIGGGMRQSGIMAAAGIISMTEMIERLADDHAHAKTLAEGLAAIPGVDIDPETVKTNIVFIKLGPDAPISGADLVTYLREKENIWIGGYSNGATRAVTHYWIGEKEVEALINGVKNAFANGR